MLTNEEREAQVILLFCIMLRRLKDQLDGGKSSQTLPGTSYHSATSRWNPLQKKHVGGGGNNANSFRDGSAASIHTGSALQKTWQRASVPKRVTWTSLLTCIFMVWFGWRWIRYSNAGILLNCHSVTCELTVTPRGWGRQVRIPDMARDQLVTAVGIKASKDGTFVTDKNIVLTESYAGNTGSKKYKKSSSYKGPDENGHYLAYAIVLTDKPQRTADGGASESGEDNVVVPDADLKLLLPYMDEIDITDDGGGGDRGGDRVDKVKQYRLIPRKFGVRQSKRRVRTMVQKVESYSKRRRQKLVLREFAPPSWQGVSMIVLGIMGVLLVCVLGQFSDPVVHRGPGVRRQQQQQQSVKKQRDSVKDAYKPATPSQYEVSTTSRPVAAATTATSGYRRNTTQARKRGS